MAQGTGCQIALLAHKMDTQCLHVIACNPISNLQLCHYIENNRKNTELKLTNFDKVDMNISAQSQEINEAEPLVCSRKGKFGSDKQMMLKFKHRPSEKDKAVLSEKYSSLNKIDDEEISELQTQQRKDYKMHIKISHQKSKFSSQAYSEYSGKQTPSKKDENYRPIYNDYRNFNHDDLREINNLVSTLYSNEIIEQFIDHSKIEQKIKFAFFNDFYQINKALHGTNFIKKKQKTLQQTLLQLLFLNNIKNFEFDTSIYTKQYFIYLQILEDQLNEEIKIEQQQYITFLVSSHNIMTMHQIRTLNELYRKNPQYYKLNLIYGCGQEMFDLLSNYYCPYLKDILTI